MLVHQCSSCQAYSSPTAGEEVPQLPADWTRIIVSTSFAGQRLYKKTYDLCGDCSRMPFKFGNLEWGKT
jgi:hypothetical protein